MTTPKQPRFTATHQAMARRIGKAAALGAGYGNGGPGTPAAIMTVHLKKIVVRYRQVQPFPITAKEFFEEVYPIDIFLERSANDPRWQNLMKAINVDSVTHFHIEGRDATHETFWVKPPRPMPCPQDLSETLLYAASSGHFSRVNKWVDDALIVHDKIDSALEYLRVFVGTARHPEHVKTYWPELLPFIGELPPSAAKHVERIRKADVSIPDKMKRDEITTLLATCSLLSDVESLAWVKFPDGVR